jgi:hypothetical protein
MAPGSLEATTAQGEESLGLGLASDEGFEDGTAAFAEHVADDARDLDVGVFEHPLDPIAVLDNLARELLARSGEVADLLDRQRWHEAAAHQPVREQVREPGARP